MDNITNDNNVRSLNKLLPITGLFGSHAKGNFEVRQIVGLSQREKEPHITDVLYTGQGFKNSVSNIGYHVRIKDLFDLITKAHENGEVADLTDENLSKNNLWASKESKGIFDMIKGFE
jgi:hypothetical protein